MLILFNKSKIKSYLVSVTMVIMLFALGFYITTTSEIIVTSINIKNNETKTNNAIEEKINE